MGFQKSISAVVGWRTGYMPFHQTVKTKRQTLILTPVANLESPINPTCMSLGCVFSNPVRSGHSCCYPSLTKKPWHLSPPTPSCLYSLLYLTVCCFGGDWPQIFKLIYLQYPCSLQLHLPTWLHLIHTHVFCLASTHFHTSTAPGSLPLAPYSYKMCQVLPYTGNKFRYKS